MGLFSKKEKEFERYPTWYSPGSGKLFWTSWRVCAVIWSSREKTGKMETVTV